MARKKNVVDHVALDRFARELEHRRSEVGLTQAELGALAGYSRQIVGAVERKERTPTLAFVKKMDEALQARGKILELFPRKQGAQRRRYLHEYVVLERRALTLDQFQPQVIPALLQTEDYARADLAATVPPKSPEELDELCRVRLARQQVFERTQPLTAQLVIDEGALLREVGGAQVMQAQRAHVLAQAQTPFITVQVLPFSCGAHSAQHGACTILGMSPLESLLFVETMAGGQTLTDPPLVATAIQRFGALRASALSPSESLVFLRDLIAKGHSG